MRITIERQLAIGEMLEGIRARYGSEDELEAYLDEHPQDWDARVALNDLREYADTEPTERIEDTREIVLPESALDEITFRRVELIVRIRQLGGSVDGVRKLARKVSRDKKNVSEDVAALRELGLLSVRPRGPGRAHRIELPGDRIDVHLLEAGG